jgi:hypothetical protein
MMKARFGQILTVRPSSSHPDFGNDIIEYADKFYVAGTTASYGAGSYDALLLKMHPDFTQIWFKTWGGGQIDEAINADEYGGYIYTVGYTESYGSESQNAFLLKYSSNGNLQWDYVWSAGNQPPNKPSKPSGPTGGSTYTLYTYTTSATDTENDKVYYKWDWDAYGDHDYSNWLGPYPSGQQVSAKHSWVKAKDEYGESGWSDPLSGVSIPRNKIATNSLFFGSLEQFPLLMRLLGF